MIMPYLIINSNVSLMYELKKMERYLRVNLMGQGLVLWKMNLPGRGLTKVEKHCSSGPDWGGTGRASSVPTSTYSNPATPSATDTPSTEAFETSYLFTVPSYSICKGVEYPKITQYHRPLFQE